MSEIITPAILAILFGTLSLCAGSVAIVVGVMTVKHFRTEEVDIMSVVPVVLTVMMSMVALVTGLVTFGLLSA